MAPPRMARLRLLTAIVWIFAGAGARFDPYVANMME